MSATTPRRKSRGALHVAQTRAKSQTSTPNVDIDDTTRQRADSTTKRRAVEFIPLSREQGDPKFPNVSPPSKAVRLSESKAIDDFVTERQSVARFVRDAIATAVDKQKTSADEHRRKNREKFKDGDYFLLSTTGIIKAKVTNLNASKLAPRYNGPFKVIKVKGGAYKLDTPYLCVYILHYTSVVSSVTVRRCFRRQLINSRSITRPSMSRGSLRIRLEKPMHHRVVSTKSSV